MTPKQIIDGLQAVKDFEPRPFILDVCDEAIRYILEHETAVAEAEFAAEIGLVAEVSDSDAEQAVPTARASRSRK